jgi:hypothetical protein
MLDSSVGAAVLIAVIAILFAAGFITFWLRDKGRADEVSDDPTRARTDVAAHTRARGLREGAADEPPNVSRERRQ